jgi:hypothetical protein|eukprot:COSAG02_NODE_5238_length_4513_cov_5.055279_6_plen_87_part_00
MAGYVNPVARQTGEVGSKSRARELGIPFEGSPGPHNAITDVPGVATPINQLIRTVTFRDPVASNRFSQSPSRPSEIVLYGRDCMMR